MNNCLAPDYLSKEEIWETAEEFRLKFIDPPETIPVPMESIIEFKLGIEIIPKRGLQASCDIEAFLNNSLSTIIVDNDRYNDQRYENRLRFTYAHEIGHLILHEEIIKSMDFRDTDHWMDFYLDQDNDSIRWCEWQASQFAGRLLVPPGILTDYINQEEENIATFRSKFPDKEDVLLEGLSNKISSYFGVSSTVIRIRLDKEGIIY